ncbi:hypothetical protein OKW40_005747 [Paraburkholderia sp. RAU6.4a]|uniref:hypothetical protein n=1 Tax=Paraburkholderia sp. RAU6.4a TaxID=2991067 RepID=UPI003D1F4C5A
MQSGAEVEKEVREQLARHRGPRRAGDRTAIETAGGSHRAQPVVFLKQLIEKGIGAMEDAWLPQEVVAQVRSGTLPERQRATTLDLFRDSICEQ